MRRYARWRAKVWRSREITHRRNFLEAIDRGDGHRERAVEELLNIAMSKRIIWKRRSGA
jgi:hypothetical protein